MILTNWKQQLPVVFLKPTAVRSVNREAAATWLGTCRDQGKGTNENGDQGAKACCEHWKGL